MFRERVAVCTGYWLTVTHEKTSYFAARFLVGVAAMSKNGNMEYCS